MRNKKLFPLILVLTLLQTFSVHQASASSCGTVKSAIIKEERVGRLLWSEFRSVTSDYGTLSKEIAITEAYLELLKSDTTRYSLANKNIKCFSPVISVKIRKNLTLIQSWLEAQKTNLETLNDPNLVNCDEEFCPTGGYEDVYLLYKSIYSLSGKSSMQRPGQFQLNE